MTAPQLKNPLDPTMAATQAALNPRHYLAEVTGIVSVTPSSGPALRVPLHAAVRPASDMHATQTSFVVTSPNQTFTLGLTGTGVDNGASPPVDVRSLVSVFELQSVSPAQPPTASPEARAADLRYVGVSSSGRLNQVANTSFLYFGLASERNWLRPSSEVIFSVLIDNNRDGTFESELYNGHLVTGADEDTDVFVTKLFNIGAGVTTIPTYLNVLQATIPSAIFDSNVLVMGVRADQLGLSTTNSRFNYKVNVWYRGSIRDSTPTLTYDWLRPGADIFSPTVPAVIYNDLPGNTTSITFNQTSYQQNNSLGLLLLHHYNRDGQRAEVVNIGQAQTVSFAAGSPTSKLVTDPPFAVSATASSGLPVTIASQTPAVCTINGSNVVALVTGGTCTLRAAQAGNSTFLPASTDLTITVLGPCSPRPRVGLSTSRLPNGSLQVTVTAGSGSIQSVRFATDTRPLVNATVQIQTPSGTQVITTGTTVTMPPNTTSKTFTATRNAAGAMTVPMIVTDGCGVWQTFVGMGTGV
jgi:hypothetical protein